MDSCPSCGVPLPGGSRFCPQCGRRPDGSGARVLELPPDETGRVPVAYGRTEPRLYGVTPSTLVLVLAAAALTLAIVLFATGTWPIALILLGVSVLAFLLFLQTARRKPSGTISRASAEALEGFRARAGVAAESWALRGRAAGRLVVLRRELARMNALRGQLLLELGAAVYRGDYQATETARAQVAELDQLVAQREVEMQAVVSTAQERMERRKLQVQRTEMVELPQEPFPPPDEGQPPEPAIIPEQYPPPDEGTPPQPAVIPEPGPAVIPEPGPTGEAGG